VKECLNQNVEENIGNEMIFGLVSTTQEFLNTFFDQLKIDREEKREKQEREHEESERKKFEGTRVSVETFMRWRLEFEMDMGISEKRAKENEANRKLTGRELFLKDQSLLDSDIRFLNENGDSIDNVKIDESEYILCKQHYYSILKFASVVGLFQNLDLDEDLPSEDESDDEDWQPS
jgi:hypothetical protein